MPLAILPASPDVEKALPAMLDAWLNLSHREKASELVMVRAIAIASVSFLSSVNAVVFSYAHATGRTSERPTNQRQPDEHEPHKG